MVELHDELAEKITKAGAKSEWTMANMIQPIPTLFAQHGVEKGGNVLGLDRATENLVRKSSPLTTHPKFAVPN